MLFDELDAHMHPSQVDKIVDALKSLVNQSKVQVILTTHDPTTASLFDENNLFLQKVNENKVEIYSALYEPYISKEEIFYNLTSNLMIVNSPFKILFVEGNDAKFYERIKQILNKTDFYKIPSHFKILISSQEKGSKNKADLKNTLKSLSNTSVLSNVYGLVDDDGDSDCNKIEYINNLFYLKRHSLENYVLDPVNVYFFLKKIKSKNGKKLDPNAIKVLENIEKKLNDLGKNYANYTLFQIIESLYLKKDENCIKIFETIINEFIEIMVLNEEKNCAKRLIKEDITCCNLFNLPIIHANDGKQSIKNDFRRNDILIKLYHDLILSIDFHVCLNLIEESNTINLINKVEFIISKNKKKIPNKDKIGESIDSKITEFENYEKYTNEKKAELFKKTFKDNLETILKKYNDICEKFEEINHFDLKKIKNKKSIWNERVQYEKKFTDNSETISKKYNDFKKSEAKKNFDQEIKYKKPMSNEEVQFEKKPKGLEETIKKLFMKPIDYLNLKKLVDLIQTIKKYEEFETFHSNETDLEKRIKEKLNEKKTVCINKLEFEHRKFFLNFNVGHCLESFYSTIFENCGINCNNLIEYFESEISVFIPDDLVFLFRNLCNNIKELTEETFEETIYNSNKNWFIKFNDKNEKDIDRNFIKLYSIFNLLY